MQTLYKKDTSGKIRYLDVSTIGATLIQTSGVVGTENPITHQKECKGKNLGKKNETSPSVQATKELESLITEKLQEGYFKTIEAAQTEETLFPMLAKDYKKEFKKIDWKSGNTFAQPKLDGMRCLITVTPEGVTLKSRDGRFIETMQHISAAFKAVTPGTYDGELYAHGYSFQENMEFVKKWRDGDEGSIQIQFHCYDVVHDKLSFKERLLVRDINLAGVEHVVFVETIKINSEDELIKAHSKYVAEQYEGTIVRHGLAPYKINGRSSNLLKYKDFQDIALPILDVIPCRQRTEWGDPVFYWEGAKGHRHGDNIIGAGVKMSHATRIDMLKNKENYIGKTAELRFFEYSDTGVPRFPVMHGIRLDK